MFYLPPTKMTRVSQVEKERERDREWAIEIIKLQRELYIKLMQQPYYSFLEPKDTTDD